MHNFHERVFRPQHLVGEPTAHPLASSPAEKQDAIPDRAHFVYVVDGDHGDIRLDFSHALVVFAARYYWRPRGMLLHTNAGHEALSRARAGRSGKWTRIILNLPEMTIRRVSAPTIADNGVPIRHVEHRSDFVRVQAVRHLGGVYLDFDAHVLRDIRPLLRAGFDAVAGREADDLLVSGVFMAKKGARLVDLWYDEMHRVYDGNWTTHSNDAMTRIGQSLVSHPGEMLILDRAALAPGSWTKTDCSKLFRPHPDDDDEAWTLDYSDTYVLHAFSPRRARHQIEGFAGITPAYVLANRSNFARAVQPVARYMLERGLIDLDGSDLAV
ncbi:glycosyl transferase [Ophiocordyceps camponoti-floridani]|uniref:Glycosyl transferase n=1 Tax=Ophiocordyceps camponoti-floridani TaxID=2030778 RepID=A0A8H4Q9Z9_9HYPO|nr:glycosyl transferase [Ophiocordyceps camponoti-floridani]